MWYSDKNLNLLVWVLVAFLMVFQNAYTMRWGMAYRDMPKRWYKTWKTISFWIRVMPFPIIWFQHSLAWALIYGIIVSVFYTLIENLFLGKGFFKSPIPQGNPTQLVNILFHEALVVTFKLCVVVLLFIAIIFNW
jgi:hypothetical protein